jgi:site-specific recombinase XerC
MSDYLSAVAPRAVFDRYLTRADEKKLLAHIGKHGGLYALRDHAWIRLLRQTGFRLGSLRGLTVGDARHALSSRRLRADSAHAKGGRGYDVALNRQAEQALRDALRVRRAMRLPEDPDGALFCSRLGQAMAERTYQQRMQMWRQSAGLDAAASPHWLRHTFAKRVMETTEHRDPQGVVQSLLGQASRASTVIYTLPDKEDLERAVEAAGR